MSLEFYRVLHAFGALLLFLSLGGILFAARDQHMPRIAMILHGVALLVMVFAGVGMVHQSADTATEISWGPGLYAKSGCWVLLAVMPTLLKKGLLGRYGALLLTIAAGGAAAWIAIMKPV